ncbi:MAG: Alanyl-tRNA synthetase [uncultured bacterium (gcode 4)]|uniref:alanine--tRNA ligase n=1 Tax=uncultured bacterium (gcode 4) TaxID=1234023 RepID=K2G5E5_9BACT|nr:MAG: Alanyl-tRNA synthetase [uncultured bacterium (gcode 4)]
MNITSTEIRQKYLEFFKMKNHAIIESSPLVPENDPSVLFNTAWMQPLVPYLLWEKHPMWTRLADVQKCIRTNDIEDVWDNTHLTFFEMLWNWSLWDYFKKESIEMSYELLTDPKWFWINPAHLAVTVFEWDENAPRDDFSAWVWKSLWIPETKISYMWEKDNWWAAGPTWPCWPDTEIFYWVWEWEPPMDSNVKNDENNWMEIWNNVFMEFNKLEDGTLHSLPSQNVDTWMWLERITRTLNRSKSVYDTDIFSDVISKVREIVGNERYIEKSARIIADHLRASTMMISDWVIPKNVDQWYILRRLIRRAIREFFKMGYETPIISEISKIYIGKFKNIYASVGKNEAIIIDELNKEEQKFSKTIKDWIKEFDKLIAWFQIAFERSGQKITQISWDKAFRLYDTYWFPIEMTEELASEKWLTVDKIWFNSAFEKHQELSRTASEWKFKWGLGWSWEMETKYHTATHLLLAWLRKTLGNHVHQAWSNITAERLRFDFTHSEKVTPEQLKEVEDFVNSVISSWASVTLREMKKDEAMLAWIVWSFWEKYPDIVKIYSIVWNDWEIYSQELCGWPHASSAWDLGKFKIQKEEASSSWVRRIKAILE